MLRQSSVASDNDIHKKRRKLDDDMPSPRLCSVLADELITPVAGESVVCATLAKRADISVVMRELMQRVPITPRLNQHLKRVRNDHSILLFDQRDFHDELARNADLSRTLADELASNKCVLDSWPNTQLQAVPDEHLGVIVRRYLHHKQVPSAVVDLLCSVRCSVQQVASRPPALRWQLDLANEWWPCKFHPNREAEAKYANQVFSDTQSARHLGHMRTVLAIGEHCNGGRPVGLAVDPRSDRIVAVGCAELVATHPLMHSSMVLIDAVARSQNAGAWNNWIKAAGLSTVSTTQTNGYCLDGVPEHVQEFLIVKFPNSQIGAQTIDKVSSVKGQPQETDAGANDNLSKFGPYLCTGYDVYLTEEPCMMCAMALVHSRVRTVFYERRTANGALGTRCKLHTVRALNHHYDVYELSELST